MHTVCDNVLATDIVFVIDTSSSVTHENFHKMKDFVSNIVRNFDVDAQLTRVSVSRISDQADFESYSNADVFEISQFSVKFRCFWLCQLSLIESLNFNPEQFK